MFLLEMVTRDARLVFYSIKFNLYIYLILTQYVQSLLVYPVYPLKFTVSPFTTKKTRLRIDRSRYGLT